jgi:hypothetical protein
MKIYGKTEMRGPFWTQRVNTSADVSWSSSRLGRLVYAKITDTLWFCGLTAWIEVAGSTSLINTNQTMVFFNYPLPTNWTLKTDIINDRMIILEPTTPGAAGTYGGTWIISGMNNTTSTHNHYAPGGVSQSSSSTRIGKSDRNDYQSQPDHRHYLSYDGTHTHTFDGGWRTPLVFGIVGVYSG